MLLLLERMFDIVQADASISDELKEEIEKDGIVIYEKTAWYFGKSEVL